MSLPAPDAPTLSWSTGRSRTTATWSPIHDQSWSSFVRWLEPDQPAASKEVRPYVGGTLQHGRRTIRTVEQRFFLTLDADYADPFFPVDVGLEFSDTPYLIHTTWRHTLEAHRYRLIVPLSRGVEPNEYKELAWTVMNRLEGKRFDVTTAQAERFMWSPSSADEATYFWDAPNGRGVYLPVDEWLDGHHGPSDAPADGGQGNPPPSTFQTSDGLLTASDEDRERAQELLLKACEEVEHVYERDQFAGRNEAVFHWMPMLFRFCGAGALDEEMVTDALWTAAQRVEADEPYDRTEFNASVRSARQYAEETGPSLPETTPTKMAQADFEDVEVEIDIWGKTDVLAHVYTAARSGGRNPLAMLAVVVARVLHEVDPLIYLPGNRDGYIGGRAALNLGVALVGSSGQGKSFLKEESMALLGVEQEDLFPSTGQGLIASYLKWNPELQENELVPDPRAFFYVDEIDNLGALAKDTGSTLFSEMRTMLTGGSTGSSNATKERQRKLPAGSYNFQLVAGVQPRRAGVLLEGQDAGTPQRFIWIPVLDKESALPWEDRPEWPGSLEWSKDFMLAFEFGEPYVKYPRWLLDELKAYDYKITQEDADGGEMSKYGHQNLLRLKVAAGIAFLHQSYIIEDLHVEIADMILAVSRRTQRKCEKAVAEAAFLKKKAARSSDERVSEAVSDEKLKRLVKNTRSTLLGKMNQWVDWSTIRLAHRDRAEYAEPVWQAIIEMDDVEHEEEPHGQRVHRKVRITDDTD